MSLQGVSIRNSFWHRPMKRNPGGRTLTSTQVRVVLVAGYVAFNVFAAVGAITDGMLSGDFRGFPAPSTEVNAILLAAIIASYAAMMFPVFNAFQQVGRFRKSLPVVQRIPTPVHVLVLGLGTFQLLFSILTGIGTAGSFVRSDNPLRFIVYVIPIDLVSLIYLAAAERRHLYRLNVVVYLISSLARGWSFGIVLLLIIGAFRANGVRITPLRVLVVIAAFMLIGPLLLLLRFQVREGAGSLLDALAYTDLLLEGQSIYLYIAGFAVDRLQHFTSVAYILESRAAIAAVLDAGDIRPFYLDGTYFAPLASALGRPLPLELNSWLTASFHGLDFDAVAYNTHVGLLGWPIAAPSLTPVYVLYIGSLGLVSVMLSRLIGSRFVVELTWLIWLLFLMNGWFGAFVSYVVALIFFRALQLGTRPRPRAVANALRGTPGTRASTA
jgi:hypothetical protein